MPWHIAEQHSECPVSRPFAVVKDDDETVEGCHGSRADAEEQLAALYANEPTMARANGTTEILTRSDASVLDDVNFKDRIVDVIAVPWDQEADVHWRGELWRESFDRHAFDDAARNSVRIPVNREHSRGDTVGRIVNMESSDPRGLLASVKIARTPRGDDTLQLAAEGMLGGSVGYFVRKPSDVILNRRSMLRRVMRAFMEHFSMVESPAFVGAETVAVHDGLTAHPAAGEQRLVTPSLDEFMNDDILSWANSRLSK